jgi:hypothetical protein
MFYSRPNLPALGGRLYSKFATSDPHDKAFVDTVIAAADACFSDQCELIDLATGAVTGVIESPIWYSLDFREWCRLEPDRYLSCFLEGKGDAARYFGSRPVLSPAG